MQEWIPVEEGSLRPATVPREPPVREPKQQVTIRLPPATLARLRALGPGWQNVIEQAVDEKLARMGGAEVG